jgi:hypothetical protein
MRHQKNVIPVFSSQTTHTGHFYLTKLLLPLLTATAKNSPPGSVRVVNVSSIGHHMPPSGGIQWSTLSPGDNYLAVGKKLGATVLYNQSKLVNETNLFQHHPFSNLLSSIGKCPLLQRTRSTIRRGRHCLNLLTPRSHQDRSFAQFKFFRGTSFRTNNELRCLTRCNQLFVCGHCPCCG